LGYRTSYGVGPCIRDCQYSLICWRWGWCG
jgi:hypothetical protein